MDRKFKFSLIILLFMVSFICAAGTSAALKEQTENSLEVSDVISISNVTDSYFEELARDENVTYTDRTLLGCWSPDGSKVLVLTRYAPLGEPELDAFYLVNADGTEPKEIIATRNNTMDRSLELVADEYFKIARWNSAGDSFAFNANVVRVNNTFVVINGETFVGAAGMGIVCIADVDGDVVRSVGTGLSGVDSIRVNSTDIGRVHGLEWEPDGTDAAVIIDGQLHVTDQYVSFLNQLTNSSIEESIDECMWNHQGNRIAFAGEDLWIIDKHDGSSLKKLASNADRLIGWSLDDSMIYYSSFDDGISSQYVVRLNDSKITKMSTGSLDDSLIIGPDGRILFTTTFASGKYSTNSCLYVADADGNNQKLLEEKEYRYPAYLAGVSWSPKGDKITVSDGIINADGSAKVDIPLRQSFSWHPSGDYIAFETGDSVGKIYTTRVCIANSDGSGITQISPDDDCSYSFDGWSPDGSRMLITRYDLNFTKQELLVVSFEGFEERSLNTISPEAPSEEWNISLGVANADVLRSVEQTSDGGYIVAGTSKSLAEGSKDVWLVKLDKEGNIEWNNTYGDKYAEWGFVAKQTSDEGYALSGYSFPNGFGQPYLLKVDKDGNEEWSKIDDEISHDDYLEYVAERTSDGGYIIADIIEYEKPDPNGLDLLVDMDINLTKYDRDGVREWNTTFGQEIYSELIEVDLHPVRQTSDDGYIIAGTMVVNKTNNYDIWLIKTDESGNEQWNKTYGGPMDDSAFCVSLTSDNGYVIAGMYNDSWGFSVEGSAFILKTDADGNKEWIKEFSNCTLSSVEQTSDNGYVAAGIKDGRSWVVKLEGDKAVSDDSNVLHKLLNYIYSFF
ncbi:hypothetical protein [Methanolobus vulcani]|uniref:WD40-like Beta Propeller Repeat n=1 Tax=Methanolobus vulcani TaxID=38026 RepID=A0A7Z8KNH3_9EURY|nr:hypothetical protein [Methanolobus vulcani]TQD24999.1 hypothetical protein FKV42_08020 [Methanolobus vulcani]